MARVFVGFPPEVTEREIHAEWIWFVALGVAWIAFAVLAAFNLFAATVASVYVVGIVMLVCGVAQVVHAFQAHRWGGFIVWLASGALYCAAGLLAFSNPLLAAAALTLLLAVALVFSGGMRIWWSTWLRPLVGSGWIMASGLVTALAGIVFLVGWPANTVWLLGMLLAVDLAFQGVSAIAFGYALKETTSTQ